METSRVTLIALVCVVFFSQKRISGAEVEMRVRRGDDVTLYSDCICKSGFKTVWFRNCSHQNRPPLKMSIIDLMRFASPRYSFVSNGSTNTHNLLITNVTESDLGLYYCAIHETFISNDKVGVIIPSAVYHYGNKSTRLSLLETSPRVTVSPKSPCVSEWSVSWKLMLSVCAACVLLSSLLCSICVYCLCTNTTKAKFEPDLAGSHKRTTRRHDEVGDNKVCYASMDIQNLKKKMKRKKRVQHSDFSTYSEVRTERTERS